MSDRTTRPIHAVLVPGHPSADLFEVLDEALWEALAVAAAENILAAPAAVEADAKLVGMGLLHESGRPTGAGYALLLRWHQNHRRPRGLWFWSNVLGVESRHVIRMRTLWGC